MQHINLNEISYKYNAFFVDIWGVLHDGVMPYKGAIEMLDELSKKNLLLLSNSPRPSNITGDSLRKMGFKIDDDQIVTSGVIAREFFQNLKGKSIYHLGAEGNKDLLNGIEISIVDNLENADLLLISTFKDTFEDINALNKILDEAAVLNIDAICPNPDIVVVHGGSRRYCAGYFANMYEKKGGTVKYFGKPYKEVYEYAARKVPLISKAEILMIGDTIDTDVKGANSFGIDSALVMTGNTDSLLQDAAISSNALDAVNFLLSLKNKHNPTYLVPGFF